MVFFLLRTEKKNIRRAGEIAKLFVDCGIIVLATFISPYRSDRETVRSKVDKDELIEIYVDCTLEKL
ncbi:hypothetical protein GCM10020331_053000 [Ectobacillus funiculus]